MTYNKKPAKIRKPAKVKPAKKPAKKWARRPEGKMALHVPRGVRLVDISRWNPCPDDFSD